MTLDLQSGQSYWLLRNTNLPVHPGLDRDERADVVVVGAGITGALAAAMLADDGFDVVVLDRRALAQGSTGASTALISYEPDLSTEELAAIHGLEAAGASYRAARDANEALEQLIRRLDIKCGYERASSLYVARTLWQALKLRTEHRLRNQNHLPCDYLSARELRREFGLNARAALRSREAAQLDPVRLTVGLLDHAIRCGARCYRAHVTGTEAAAGGWVATTAPGPRVIARRIAFATGYETQQWLRQPSVTLQSTYAVATDAVAGLSDALRTAVLWDTGRPYHYLRSADGRLLVGDADVPFVDETARDALMTQKANDLLRYARDLLPGLALECFSVWCGTFARTRDSLPFIGNDSAPPGVFYSLGYGGNGITAGMLGAQLLLDAMHGRRRECAALFSFQRALQRTR